MPLYFYVEDIAYKTTGVAPQYCSLHGEFIGYHVTGRKIKLSGKLGNAQCCFSLKQLRKESRDMVERYIQQMEEK